MFIAIIVILSVLLFLAAVAAVIFFVPITVKIDYKDNVLKLRAGFGKLLFGIPLPKPKEKDEKYIKIPKFSWKDIKNKILAGKNFYNENKAEISSCLGEAGGLVNFSYLNISIKYGFGDAAITGIANAPLWTAIGAVSAVVRKYFDLKGKLNICLNPMFTEQCFNANVYTLFRVRLYSAYKLFKKYEELLKKARAVL